MGRFCRVAHMPGCPPTPPPWRTPPVPPIPYLSWWCSLRTGWTQCRQPHRGSWQLQARKRLECSPSLGRLWGAESSPSTPTTSPSQTRQAGIPVTKGLPVPSSSSALPASSPADVLVGGGSCIACAWTFGLPAWGDSQPAQGPTFHPTQPTLPPPPVECFSKVAKKSRPRPRVPPGSTRPTFVLWPRHVGFLKSRLSIHHSW